MTVRRNAADIVSLFKCEQLYMLGAQVVHQQLELLDITRYNYERKRWSRRSARIPSENAVHGTGRELWCDSTMAVFRIFLLHIIPSILQDRSRVKLLNANFQT